jgi:mono/diheme cytochrome c family protein
MLSSPFNYAKRGFPLTALIAVGVLWASVSRAPAAETEELLSFEINILPIVQANCLVCHGENLQQNGLDLRTRDSIQKGGESGPAIVPGSAEESLLFEKVSSGEMPMGGEKLSDEEIERIRHWINAGALNEGEDAETANQQRKLDEVTQREVLGTILKLKCVMCHGRRKQEGNLDLRTRAGLLKGGKSGPAIIPGNPEESVLIRRLEAEEMHPPDPKLLEAYLVRPLNSSELEKLRQWIAAGAPAGDEVQEVGSGPDPLVRDEDRKFWSFQPPKRPPLPRVRNQQMVRTPIDAFLLKKLESKGLSFSPEADRLTLIRRAYFDLIGLPPAPEEVEKYLEDESPKAYERMIGDLLDSPHYGERWGKYWLDAVGYADTEGHSDVNPIRPHAYRYRDYVIRSLNNDKPYDQFLLEQIAGDELFDYKSAKELTPEQLDYLVATGFLRMGPDGTSVHLAQEIFGERFGVVADEVEILSSAVMGLTVGCARCHSHKFDPLPHRDYYRLSAIFEAAYDPYDWLDPTIEGRGGEKDPYKQTLRYLPYADERERREVAGHNAPIQKEIKRLERSLELKAQPLREELFEQKLAKLPEGIREDVRKAIETPEGKQSDVQKYLVRKFEASLKVEKRELEEKFEDFREQAEKIKKAIQKAKKRLRPEPMIRALFDMGGEPRPVYVLRRGDYRNLGPRVEPGVPSMLRDGIDPYKIIKPAWDTTGRRLALARWLVQPHHPLTGRVMVNRIWQDHFGTGLVATPGNFGKLGVRPTHPELLDWLAREFVGQGWSLKAMHKQIMTSAAYRQSSRWDAKRHGPDPDNLLLSRFPLRRMDAEALRDSILKVAGRLDSRPFGPPDEVEVKPNGEVAAKGSSAGFRRTIYMLQPRPKWAGEKAPPTILEVFDVQPLSPNSLKRAHSTVSSQALQLMNSDVVRENSRYFAGRVMDAVGADVEKQIERAYLTALSRRPSSEEMKLGHEAVGDFTQYWFEHLKKEVPAEPKQLKAPWLGLATFCHMLLNSPEFVYID